MGEDVDFATVVAAGDGEMGNCGSGANCGNNNGGDAGVAGVGAEPPLQDPNTSLVGTPSGITPHKPSLPGLRELQSHISH